MNKIDLTYSGEIPARINVLKEKNMLVDYTIDGETGEVTTTSFLIDEEKMLMVTFDYQDLKKLVDQVEGEQ